MSKNLVIGIDVGITQIGFAAINIDNGDIFIEKSSLTVTKDGRKYKKYEEGLVHELVYTWLKDRWEDFFKYAKIVLIEKQLTQNKHTMDRACIVIETAMKCYITAYIPLGGPLCLVVHPMWWKRKAGIQVGGHGIAATTPFYDDDGRFHHGNINPNRMTNKKRALAVFKDLVSDSDEEALRVHKKYGKSLDVDMTEAYLIARVAKQNLDEIIEEALITSNHHAALTSNNETKSLNKKKRCLPLRAFTEDIKLLEYKEEEEEEEGSPPKKKRAKKA